MNKNNEASEFDYVIVGAGSAGCVFANRLSADGKHSVLLLEAGPKDSNLWIHVPLDKLDAEATALAARLAKQPAGAVSTTKRLMRNPELLMAQIKAESEQFAARLQTAEAREAFAAFAERRPPDFLKLAKQPA